MRYPFWLPYPSCWLKAVMLWLSFLPVAAVIFVIWRLGFIPAAIFMSLDKADPFITAWVVLMVLIVPIFILSHIHQFLWGEPNPKFPVWLPSIKSLGEGFWGWGVIIGCMVFTILVTVNFHLTMVNLHVEHRYQLLNINDDPAEVVYIIPPEMSPIILIVAAAYCYHVRYLIERQFSKAHETIRQFKGINRKG